MIRLKSLQLEGYLSIREMPSPMDFGALTVLLGANGSGKSNLMSFFQMLNYLTNESLQKFISINGGPDCLLHFGVKHTRQISAVLEFETERGMNTYRMTLAHAKARVETMIFTEESADFRAHGEQPHPNPFTLGAGHSESGLMDPRYSSETTVRFFKRALRGFRFYQFHDTSPASPLRRSRCERRLTKPFYGDGGNLPAVLSHLQEKHPELYGRLIHTIRLAAPFFRDFNFDTVEGRAEEPDVQLSWTSEGPDYSFGMHQLSDGTLRFIALATLLLLPEEMRPEGCVLIDEPELGLHPKALSVLAGLIHSASEETQIICTTQSPDFLDNFEAGEVVVVDRKGGASTFDRIDGERLKAWMDDDFQLGEIWTKNLIGGRPHRD